MSETDALDVPLVDAELLAEVHLTTDLIVAVQAYDRHLDRAEIDRLLRSETDAEVVSLGVTRGRR